MSGKRQTHKSQHFVPRSYLAAWCDPSTPADYEPYVWVFPRGGGEPRRRAPKNLFAETDMYTVELEEGERCLHLESSLSQIESDFCSIRDNKILKGVALNEEEIADLCLFMAAMTCRTAGFRDLQQEQWGGLVETMETMQSALDSGLEPVDSFPKPLDSKSRESFNLEQAREMANYPLQNSLIPNIQTIAPTYAQMNLAIFVTQEDLGFISSDHPCIWTDPEACKRPPFYQATGLGYETVEVSMPISPGALAFLSWQDLEGVYDLDSRPQMVDEFNRATQAHCHKEFVVRKNEVKEIWFFEGNEPDDSWKNEQSIGEDEGA